MPDGSITPFCGVMSHIRKCIAQQRSLTCITPQNAVIDGLRGVMIFDHPTEARVVSCGIPHCLSPYFVFITPQMSYCPELLGRAGLWSVRYFCGVRHSKNSPSLRLIGVYAPGRSRGATCHRINTIRVAHLLPVPTRASCVC